MAAEAQQDFDQADFPEDFEIHQSAIGTMHGCAREWMLRYKEGVRIPVPEAPTRYGPMVRGTVTHTVSAFCRSKPRDGGYSVDDVGDILQKAWAKNKDAQQLPEDELPKWGAHAKWVVDHLDAHADEQIIGLNMPLSTEQRPLSYRGIPVQGELDELVRPEQNGQLLVRDLKTGRNTPNETNLICDVQANVYTWAARQQAPGEVGFEVWHMPRARAVPEKAPLVLSQAELERFEVLVLDNYLLQISAGFFPPNTQRQYGGCASCMYGPAHCWGRI